MKYIKSDHYLIDYRKNSREFLGSFYATKEFSQAQGKIVLVSYPLNTRPNASIVLEGADKLGFKTYVDGQEAPVSSGRFLNTDYEEMIFGADLAEKGLNIDGTITKVSDDMFVSTKTVRIKATGEIGAVIQEIIRYLSKEDFEKATAKT
ncbi:hypothetical protein [Bdellovibrio sp. HCB337]|uniref:hypothetical protein n=1 Tax=Bdellovibrio sp. HCB337 TaxID=3394358 RepID=UPI0039A56C41